MDRSRHLLRGATRQLLLDLLHLLGSLWISDCFMISEAMVSQENEFTTRKYEGVD